MPPRMMTRSANRAIAAPRGRRTDGRTGKGGGKTRGRSVNDNIQGNARNVIENNNRRGCTYKEFLACNPKEYDGVVTATEPTTIQKAVQIAGTLTDEAIRNGSIKKNPKKIRNVGEPSKDRNGRDDNKRTRTGNAFATTTNHVRRENTGTAFKRENTGTAFKCTTCNLYHPPEASCRTCFNCNRPRHLVKSCRVVPRNVNPLNVRNPAAARGACFEFGGTDHYKSACPRLNRAQSPGVNHPNQDLAIDGG
nr:hypothetical protein [Tanacetum cinerariifolium]